MTTDTKLRELADRLVSMAPEPPPYPKPPAAPVTEERRFRPVLVLAAAAAVVILLLGLIPILLGGGGGVDSDPVDTPVPPTSAATTIVESTQTQQFVSFDGSAPSPVESWRMIPLPIGGIADLFQGEIENLHAEWLFPMSDGRLFAVGSASTYAQEWQSLVWTTDDLLAWQRIDVGARMDVVEQIIPWESNYLARGTHEGDGDYETVYATSRDGIAWTEIEFSEQMPPEISGDSFSRSFQEWFDLDGPPCIGGFILRTDDATTAVCRDTDGNVMTDEPVAFWDITSEGSWEALPTDSTVDKTQFGDVYSVGDAFITGPDERGFFTSVDGRVWSFVEVEPTDLSAEAITEQMAVVGEQLVVVGNSSDDWTTPVVWIADLEG